MSSLENAALVRRVSLYLAISTSADLVACFLTPHFVEANNLRTTFLGAGFLFFDLLLLFCCNFNSKLVAWTFRQSSYYQVSSA